jgi:hypothetical protein
VGALPFLVNGTQADTSAHVNYLARYNKVFGNEHIIALKDVIRYTKETKELGLLINPAKKNQVNLYTDTDWGFFSNFKQ